MTTARTNFVWGEGLYGTKAALDAHQALGAALIADNVRLARAVVESLPAGVSPDFRDLKGTTALILASASGRLEICELLVQAGADPSLRDHFGRTAAAVFGADCSDVGPKQIPSEEARTRAAALFSAAVAGGELPEGYALRFLGERGADASEKRRTGRRVVAAHRGIEVGLAARSLPCLVGEAGSVWRGRVWLLASEVAPFREAVEEAAGRKKLAGKFGLERLGEGGS